MQYNFFFSVNWSVFVWNCVKEISGKEYVIQFVVGWIRLDNICCIQWTHMFHDSLSFITGDFFVVVVTLGIALWCFFFTSFTHLSRSSITTKMFDDWNYCFVLWGKKRWFHGYQFTKKKIDKLWYLLNFDINEI